MLTVVYPDLLSAFLSPPPSELSFKKYSVSFVRCYYQTAMPYALRVLLLDCGLQGLLAAQLNIEGFKVKFHLLLWGQH